MKSRYALLNPLLTAFVLVTIAQDGFAADDDVVTGESRKEALARVAAEEVRAPAMSLFDRSGIPQYLQVELNDMVDRFRANYDLTEGQQVRLRFAGRNDIQRVTERLKDQHNAKIVVGERRQMFGRGSFTEKVIPRILTGAQLSRYHSDLDERQRLQHRSDIEGVIRDLQRHVVLKTEQEETLVDLMLCELPPIVLEGISSEVVVKFRFSNLPSEVLKPLLTDRQWERVKPVLDGYRVKGAQQGIDRLLDAKEKQDRFAHSERAEGTTTVPAAAPPLNQEVTQ